MWLSLFPFISSLSTGCSKKPPPNLVGAFFVCVVCVGVRGYLAAQCLRATRNPTEGSTNRAAHIQAAWHRVRATMAVLMRPPLP